MRHEWMPGKQADILAMAKTWSDVLTAGNRWEDWDFLESEFQELKRLYAEARFRFDENNSARRGPATAEKLRTALAALTTYMRIIKERRLLVPPLTNGDLVELGLRPRDKIRTEHVAVAEIVDFTLKPGAEKQIVVDFRQRGEAHKAKPPMYDGAVIIWGFSETEPADNDQLPRHAMASRTPHTLHFSQGDRGKKVWVSAAWQNERGILGEWAAYKSAIVP